MAWAYLTRLPLSNKHTHTHTLQSGERWKRWKSRKEWVTSGSKLFGDVGLNAMTNELPSGIYSAEYTERGEVGRSTYNLKFTSDLDSPSTGTVTGYGSDADGKFVIDGGVFDLSTGRVAWGERSDGALYSEVKLKWEGKAKMRGSYSSNLHMAGDLQLAKNS